MNGERQVVMVKSAPIERDARCRASRDYRVHSLARSRYPRFRPQMTEAEQYDVRGDRVRTDSDGSSVCGRSSGVGTRIHLVGPLVHAADSSPSHTRDGLALLCRPTADGQSRETGYVARSLPS